MVFRRFHASPWLAVIVTFFAPFLIAAEQPVTEPSRDSSAATAAATIAHSASPMNAGSWAMILLSLLGIVALIVLLGWAAKRVGGLNVGGQQMKVVSALPVGNRERIALVDVQGKQFLVGVTPQQISLLHAFDEAVIDTSTEKKPSDFAERLQTLIKQKSSETES